VLPEGVLEHDKEFGVDKDCVYVDDCEMDAVLMFVVLRDLEYEYDSELVRETVCVVVNEVDVEAVRDSENEGDEYVVENDGD
jgi:hypothetical protein